MPVKDKDIIVLGSATMPENDTDTEIGGAVDVNVKVSFYDLSGAADNVKAVSDSASDTAVEVTFYGRLATSEIVSEVLELNGTTPTADSTNQYIEIMKAVVTAGTPAGTIAVYKKTASSAAALVQNTAPTGEDDGAKLNASATVASGQVAIVTAGTGATQVREVVKGNDTTKNIEVRDWATPLGADSQVALYEGLVLDFHYHGTDSIDTVRRVLYDAIASATEGDDRVVHEKIFFANCHASLALTGVNYAEVAGGLASIFTFAVESSLDGTGTNGAGNTRLVAPSSGVSAFDSDAKAGANSGVHSPGAYQGIWIAGTLAGAATAQDSTYTLREYGGTIA